jgi:hypothetical protein
MPVLVAQLVLRYRCSDFHKLCTYCACVSFPYPMRASLTTHVYPVATGYCYRSASIGVAARPNPFREAFGLLHDPTLHLLHRSASAKGNLVL